MILPRLLPASFLLPTLALAGALPAQTGVTAVLPNGREIHPAGNWIALAPYPFALAVRPDGGQIAVPSIGFPFALNVIADPAGAQPTVRRMPVGNEERSGHRGACGAGLLAGRRAALCGHGRLGQDPRLSDERLDEGRLRSRSMVRLRGRTAAKRASGSFAATLTVSADGKTLYALDQGTGAL